MDKKEKKIKNLLRVYNTAREIDWEDVIFYIHAEFWGQKQVKLINKIKKLQQILVRVHVHGKDT